MDKDGLSLGELEAYRGQGHGQRSGNRLRFYCPIHGGDNQRSLSLDEKTGFYKCFTCQAQGQLVEKRQEWRDLQRLQRGALPRQEDPSPPEPKPEPKADPSLADRLQEYQAALTPDSWGAKYLERRGVPLEVARRFGAGYCPPGQWVNPKADLEGRRRDGETVVKWGRVVFPHSNPAGEVVNLYGRAVGDGDRIPKANRHDHGPGLKGVFHAPALQAETCFLAEGVFDALALVVSGYEQAAAVFGVSGLRWEWVKARRVVFGFDADQAGQSWKNLAQQGILLGKQVCFLPPEDFGQAKDLNELLLAKGKIDLGELPELPARTAPETVMTISVSPVSPGPDAPTPAPAADQEQEPDPPSPALDRYDHEAWFAAWDVPAAYKASFRAAFASKSTAWLLQELQDPARIFEANRPWFGEVVRVLHKRGVEPA